MFACFLSMINILYVETYVSYYKIMCLKIEKTKLYPTEQTHWSTATPKVRSVLRWAGEVQRMCSSLDADITGAEPLLDWKVRVFRRFA